jgi:tRNA A-37 threonylcarbamoyl transferase component Bud32
MGLHRGGCVVRECLSDSEVMALAADQPLERDRPAIDAHLLECERCRARLREARATAEHGPAHRRAGDTSDSALASSVASAPSSAPEIPGYDIHRRIDSGGQGIVYKATQHGTNRTVAIKVLPHQANASERQKRRFEREVALAASLQHPGIVTVYHSGVSSGQYFFAMEYVHGRPLDEYLASTRPDVRGTMELFAKICDAVAHAHAREITHRDLKPGNILIDAAGEPHVLDFGLAKSPASALQDLRERVTLSSQFLGTLAYSAPEQGMGDPDLHDRRTDVYALGVVLFEMLTGRLPYALPGDLEGTLRAIRESSPRKPSDLAPEVGRDIDTIVLRALAKEPARRYQSAEDLARDVHHWLHDEPIEARRDSAMYILGTQARRTVRRQKVLAMAAVAALAWFIGGRGASLLNHHWPRPAVWYESAAMALASSAPAAAASNLFEHIRVIAMDDDTAAILTDLALEAGVEGVSADNWYSSRRMNGWMMTRLASAGVRGVVWDFGYASDTEFDPDFAAGVKALTDAGTGAAVGIPTWELNERGEPVRISRAIFDSHALWGGVTLERPTSSFAKMHLITQHAGSAPIISLSLAALALWNHPATEPLAELDRDRAQITMRFRPRGSSMQALPAGERITLTGVRQPGPAADYAIDGFNADSWIGDYIAPLPDDLALDRITMTYQDVARLTQAELESWARGRLVIVGDFRTDGHGDYMDRHWTDDGTRQLFGSHLHAVVIDSLMRSAQPIRYPRDAWYNTVIAVAAALGVILALAAVGSRVRRFALAAVAMLAIIVLCVLAGRLAGVICNPTGLIMAMWAGFGLWLLCEPLSHSRTQGYTYPSRSATS